MAINTQEYMDKLTSHALSSGYFASVNSLDVGSTPPNSDLIAVLYPRRIRPLPVASGLNSTSVCVEFMMRLILSMNSTPFGEIDPHMIEATDMLLNAYSGDFTLDGTIKNIDLLGEHGQALEVESGFLKLKESDDVAYRIVDIIIPCIINDVWNQAE